MKQLAILSLLFYNFFLLMDFNPKLIEESHYIKNDSLILINLEKKIKDFSRERKYDSAIFTSKELLIESTKQLDSSWMINANRRLGFYYNRIHKYDSAFSYFNDSYRISLNTRDSIFAGQRLLDMANIQNTIGDYTGSKATAIDGLQFLENKSDLRGIAGLYYAISIAFREQKNYKQALEYNSKALALGVDDIAKRKIRLTNILKFKNSRANILADQGDYEKAISILSSLISDSLIIKNKYEYARVLDNFGYIKWRNDKKNTESKTLLHNALEVRTINGDLSGLFASYIHLTKYYLNQDPKKASSYAYAAYQNAKKRNSLKSILEALDFVFELKENNDDEVKLYSKIRNELNSIKQNTQEIYKVTKYENDKLKQNTLLLKAENAEQKTQKIIFLSSAIILFLISGFFIYFLRQRHKKERIKEVYTTETRIAKKVHDELANDVYNVMTTLENAKVDIKMVNTVNDIYQRTRDISKNYNSIDTDKEYHNLLSTMLSSYAPNTVKVIIKGLDKINWQKVAKEQKIMLHRVLQELMTNMRKHSNAKLVAVTFNRLSKSIQVNYSDNGIGTHSDKLIYGNGLQNVENRIASVNGTIIFETEKGKGFKAEIQIPS
ncbi:hypothetical protein GTQ40_13495 [Flavobacteriaceae bacterium R38]|nr:hypothetical protein [Flavobacteriaceae bacterium R38]